MAMKTEQQPAYSLAHQSASLGMTCQPSRHPQHCSQTARWIQDEAVLRIPPVSSTWLGGQGRQTCAAARSATASLQVRHLLKFRSSVLALQSNCFLAMQTAARDACC